MIILFYINLTINVVAERATKNRMFEWLDAPDPSNLCTTASEKHLPGSGSWFLSSTEYDEWKKNADVPLVIWGARKFSLGSAYAPTDMRYSGLW